MKKQYITPEVCVDKLYPSAIICTSLSFGEGNTDTMHAPERSSIFDEKDMLWGE